MYRERKKDNVSIIFHVLFENKKIKMDDDDLTIEIEEF